MESYVWIYQREPVHEVNDRAQIEARWFVLEIVCCVVGAWRDDSIAGYLVLWTPEVCGFCAASRYVVPLDHLLVDDERRSFRPAVGSRLPFVGCYAAFGDSVGHAPKEAVGETQAYSLWIAEDAKMEVNVRTARER